MTGVSVTVYRKWRAATHLARESRYHHMGEMGSAHILLLARKNTEDERLAKLYP